MIMAKRGRDGVPLPFEFEIVHRFEEGDVGYQGGELAVEQGFFPFVGQNFVESFCSPNRWVPHAWVFRDIFEVVLL